MRTHRNNWQHSTTKQSNKSSLWVLKISGQPRDIEMEVFFIDACAQKNNSY